MAEFQIPSIIEEQTVDNIHARMMKTIPDDIDKSEGQFVWDKTRPTAVELSFFSQYIVVEALKAAMPQYSYGEYLDSIAQANGLERKEALYAIGTISVYGNEGTLIPLGSIFSTESGAGIESIDFATTEEATIPADGYVNIPVRCTEPGANGNVSIGTIILKSSDLPSAITGVTNTSATSGGTDEESDDALRERIADAEQSKGVSHVGSKADYKRWAEEVEGVGEALVIPAQDNSGTVTIILTDANGNPASSAMCTSVYNHIMGVKEDQSDRLASVNAALVVVAPVLVTIAVSAVLNLSGNKTLDEVKNAFLTALNKYLTEASDEGEVKYSKICSTLLSVPGVDDYTNVLVNNGTANITIDHDELAVASATDISLTEGA